MKKHFSLDFLPAALVFALTFICFIPSLLNMFVDWDDLYTIVSNFHFRGMGLSQLKWMFTTFYMAHYQPLTWLSFAADYKIFGYFPFGYHLTSVLLHSFNALILYFILVRIFRITIKGVKDKYLAVGAVLGALFFSLNPLRVESVSWTTERKDVLCAFFYLLSAVFYLKTFDRGKRRHFYISALFFIMACLSKSMAVTLPLTFLIFDIFVLKRLPPNPAAWIKKENRNVLIEKIPLLCFSAVFAAVAYFGAGKYYPEIYPPSYTPSIAKGIYAYAYYIYKTVLPFGLVPVYPVPEGGLAAYNMLYGPAMLLTAVFAFVFGKKYPALPGCLLYYLITLFPVAGFINGAPQPAADRYTYLPLLSAALLLGYVVIYALLSGRKIIKAGVPLAVSAWLSYLFGICAIQQTVWYDSVTLWSYTLGIYPNVAIAHNNLGSELLDRGMIKEGLEEFEKAIKIEPDNFNLFENYGQALYLNKIYDKSVEMYLRAYAMNGKSSKIPQRIGEIYRLLGDQENAEKYYLRSFAADPKNPETVYSLAVIYIKRKNISEALRFAGYAAALNKDQDDDEIYAVNCAAHAIAGDYKEAAALCEKAVKLNPKQENAPGILKQLEGLY